MRTNRDSDVIHLRDFARGALDEVGERDIAKHVAAGDGDFRAKRARVRGALAISRLRGLGNS
jgi:hypothetical protein